MILTAPSGLEEEAPSLGKPVLVMCDATERPEHVEAGNVRLVKTKSLAKQACCSATLRLTKPWLLHIICRETFSESASPRCC